MRSFYFKLHFLVIETSNKHFRIGSHRLTTIDFMSRMLSNPESLLNICLKRKDYVLCKRIIHYFHLPAPRYTEVAVAEKLDEISAIVIGKNKRGKRYNHQNSFHSTNKKLKEEKENDFHFLQELIDIRRASGENKHESMNEIVANTEGSVTASASLDPELHAFYMTVDLAVSIAPTASHSRRLLSKGRDVLDQWLANSGTGKGVVDPLARGLHAYFTNIVLRRYVKLIDKKSEMAEELGDVSFKN